MRDFITLLAAATLIVACADDPHPTAPGSRSSTQSANGNVQPVADKAPVGQAKPVDQVGFTKITKVFGPETLVPAAATAVAVATCPAGTLPLSGGYFVTSSSQGSGIPGIPGVGVDDTNSWTVAFNNAVLNAMSFTVIAVAYCVS